MNRVTDILRLLANAAMPTEHLLPRLFRKYEKMSPHEQTQTRVELGKVITSMVKLGYIEPALVNGTVGYTITSEGRSALWKLTAN